MIKACIFDLDGTLANSLPAIAHFGNLALAEHGYEPIEESGYKMLVGDGMDILIHRMLQGYKSDTPKEFEKVRASYDRAYQADVLYATQTYEGVPELLKKLKERKVKLAVCSNKPHSVAVQVVEKMFGRGYFDICVGQKPNVPIKPDPAGAVEIAKVFGVNCAECAFIGDTNVDIQTGQRAGMMTVGVLWGFRGEAELCAAGADCIIEKPLELLAKIQA